MTHDPNAPITPEVLMQHVAALRAEVATLRTVTDSMRDAAREMLAAAHELRSTAVLLTNELFELKQWRQKVDSSLFPENGAHVG